MDLLIGTICSLLAYPIQGFGLYYLASGLAIVLRLHGSHTGVVAAIFGGITIVMIAESALMFRASRWAGVGWWTDFGAIMGYAIYLLLRGSS